MVKASPPPQPRPVLSGLRLRQTVWVLLGTQPMRTAEIWGQLGGSREKTVHAVHQLLRAEQIREVRGSMRTGAGRLYEQTPGSAYPVALLAKRSVPGLLSEGQWDALDWIREYGPGTALAYSMDLGISRITAKRRIAPLRKAGLLSRIPGPNHYHHVYTVTEQGLEAWKAGPGYDLQARG